MLGYVRLCTKSLRKAFNFMTKIFLKKGKGESLKRFHPWVFSGAINRIEKENGVLNEGDVVEVYSSDNVYLGIGHYQEATISVRILSFTKREINSDFWIESLGDAFNLRERLGLINRPDKNNIYSVTNCYRLVHGEGDFLPGLIIDIYDKTAVIQAHSAGMYLAKKEIADALIKIYNNSLCAVYDKSSSSATLKGRFDLHDGYLFGSHNAVDSVMENGNKFIVNWIEGQKTGFFLDQRDNRDLVKQYAQGRRVLNLFCYTGGFSVYALKGGASHVVSVDSSKKAIDLALKNVELNGYMPEVHEAICEDAIDYLQNSVENSFDLMIVDPPAFAKHRGAVSNALRAYKRLNALAISKVAHGGIIFTFSCSQSVDKNDFALAVFSAAAISGRKVRILHRLTQPADHPVNIFHPEGEYLKGLVLYVE